MTTVSLPYLGKPGAMQQLPSPNGAVDTAPTRGDVAVATLSGGQSVVRRLNQRRTYNLPFSFLEPDDADQISGFYQGLYGAGPFVFVDPSVRNVLPLDVSTCGIRSQASPGWFISSGTLTASATGSPVAGSGVLTWTTPNMNASLNPGSASIAADPTSAPVYLPGEPVTVSVWAKVSSAGTHSLIIDGYNAAGVAVANATGSVALTTTWQRFSLSIAAGTAGFASSVFVLPRLKASAGSLTFSVAGVQLEYASTMSAWQPGSGSPRVIITASPGRSVPQYGYSDHTLILGEVG